jgi:hypothetical protein
MNPQPSSTRVSIYFAWFATITAGLLGLGQASWNLPLLVCFCSVVSIIYTDKLGWVALPRWMVFLGMVGGAGFAIFSFLGNAAANQILAVGNLLVYVQLPLMFQKKSKRVYEQWGVFLLLELVVAALVNDNVLYGMMMLPVLAVGCAAMMALAFYASQLRHSESFSESMGIWTRWLHWLGREESTSKLQSGISLSVPKENEPNPASASVSFAPSRWLTSVLPISLSVLLFSAAYFYSLPRLNSESYDGAVWGAIRVGFSDQVSLRHIGEMLQNDTPAFRMSMRDNRKQSNYRPNFPPYIRIMVSTRYFDGPSQGMWQSGEKDFSMDPRIVQKMPADSEVQEALAESADSVTVHVVEKSSFGTYVPAIAPFSRSSSLNDFRVLCRDWCMSDSRLAARTTDKKRRFSYTTYAFTNGVESTLLPELRDCLQGEKANQFGFETHPDNSYELLEFPTSLEPILPIRDKILSTTTLTKPSKFMQAILLEDYFSNGRNYTYSLSLTRPVDPDVDPIVDFMLNKRKGHCQYFSSALALMLRSLDIPSRLVVGFRPNEYNEIGQYFSVQQNHAHTWVEAYFTVEELKDRFIAMPPWIKNGAWIRLDPTPAGDGSNAGDSFRKSSGQALDAMQDLWNELVMNMDKSKQSKLLSLFGESSSSSYTGILLTLQTVIQQMQSSRFAGGVMSPDRWFSWRMAAGFIVLGTFLTLGYRLLVLLFPNWRIFKKWQSLSYRSAISRIDFYDRAVKALRKLGIERAAHQTPQEFLRAASLQLSSESIPLNGQLLSELFYARRFGGLAKLSESDQAEVEQMLQSLESNATDRNRKSKVSGS